MSFKTLALIGRPNVGKSTLFNALTRTRDALVLNEPGVTRDRKYGQAYFKKASYILIDTGGLSGENSGVDVHMADQVALALEEADLVLFLVDARVGLTAGDEIIAEQLRFLSKPIVIVANKMDGLQQAGVETEFYSLGFKQVYPIAASHRRGVQPMMEAITNDLFPELIEPEVHVPKDVFEEMKAYDEAAALEAEAEAFLLESEQNQADDENEDELEVEDDVDDDIIDSDDDLEDEGEPELELDDEDEDGNARGTFEERPIKIAIVGRPNVGKSTLTNRMLGEERMVVYDLPGTTRDSNHVALERHDKHYTLIDTAGVRRRARVKEVLEKFSVVKTLQAIAEANVALIILDAKEGVTDQDLHVIAFALDAGKAMVIAINKCDGLSEDEKQKVSETISLKLPFVADFIKLFRISALHGTGVGLLFAEIDNAYAASVRKLPTPELTRVLEDAVQAHAPPMSRGRRPKLRYAHAGGVNPPRIVIHGKQLERLTDEYQRYLMNSFRKAFNLYGTPVKIQLKTDKNPYSERKPSRLTPRQARAERKDNKRKGSSKKS
jgi:GTP-binding protein